MLASTVVAPLARAGRASGGGGSFSGGGGAGAGGIPEAGAGGTSLGGGGSGGTAADCRAGECTIDGQCVQGATRNPEAPCEVCDPVRDRDGWSVDAGAVCDDGLRCTTADHCGADGACIGEPLCAPTEICEASSLTCVSRVSRVSIDSVGREANAESRVPGNAVSREGRFVVFESKASNLVQDDLNGQVDAFIHDRLEGTTRQVSAGARDGDWPSISSDGRSVVFSSRDRPGGSAHCYVWSRLDEAAVRITRNREDSFGGCGWPEISRDGRYVGALVAGGPGHESGLVLDLQTGSERIISLDTHAIGPARVAPDGAGVAYWATGVSEGFDGGQIYVEDMQGNDKRLMSAAADGTAGDRATNWSWTLSGDGQLVAFASLATNLVQGDTNETWDVFVKDMRTGDVERASIATNGNEADSGTSGGSLSADGRFVAFSSEATNLVDGDRNGVLDVFVRDRLEGATARVSVTGFGEETDGDSWGAHISADGRFVAFVSEATNLVPGDTNGVGDVFVAINPLAFPLEEPQSGGTSP